MSLLILICASITFSAESSHIDWDKAGELLQKQHQDQTPTPEEEIISNAPIRNRNAQQARHEQLRFTFDAASVHFRSES